MSHSLYSVDNESVEGFLPYDLQRLEGIETDNASWQVDDYGQVNSVDVVYAALPEPSLQYQDPYTQLDPHLPWTSSSIPPAVGSVGWTYEGSAWSDSRSTTPVMGRSSYSMHSYGNNGGRGTGQWISPALSTQSLLSGGAAPCISENDGRYVCMECQQSFPTSYELEGHAKLNGHRTYVCTEAGCGRSYPRRDTFVRHMATHRSFEPHPCPICPQHPNRKVFKRKDHLTQHIRNRHPTAYSGSDNNHLGCDPNSDLLGQTFFALEAPIGSMASSPEAGSHRSICPCRDSICQSRDVQDIAVALNGILGEHDPAVRMIDRRTSPHNSSAKTEMARSLARLALTEPQNLSSRTKEQLQMLMTCSVGQATGR